MYYGWKVFCLHCLSASTAFLTGTAILVTNDVSKRLHCLSASTAFLTVIEVIPIMSRIVLSPLPFGFNRVPDDAAPHDIIRQPFTSPLPFGFNRVPDWQQPSRIRRWQRSSPLPFGFNRVPDIELIKIALAMAIPVSIAFRLQPRS